MSYSGSITLQSGYFTQNLATQAISAGLFEKALSYQPVFHSESKMPALAGASIVLLSIALQSDFDLNRPLASVSILNSDTISSRVGSQITSEAFTNQRLYQSTNPFIPTKSSIELSVQNADSGDLVYINQATFLTIAIKE